MIVKQVGEVICRCQSIGSDVDAVTGARSHNTQPQNAMQRLVTRPPAVSKGRGPTLASDREAHQRSQNRSLPLTRRRC